MRVIVLGAGVIGLATAYYLVQDGHEVTIVDRNDGVALETSFANGAQLSYSYVAPLAGPGVLPKIPPWLLRRDSPLRFYPRLDSHQWRWLLDFVLACSAKQSDLTTRRLLRAVVLQPAADGGSPVARVDRIRPCAQRQARRPFRPQGLRGGGPAGRISALARLRAVGAVARRMLRAGALARARGVEAFEAAGRRHPHAERGSRGLLPLLRGVGAPAGRPRRASFRSA